jgi:hypothetical protein
MTDAEKEQERIDRSRRRGYVIGHHLILEIFRGRVSIDPASADLPSDACIESVHYDPWHCGFTIFIHSMTFDPVPEGQECPQAWGPLRLRVHDEGAQGNYMARPPLL